MDVLIHGHTHRPNIHDVKGKKRIVLGDWRENTAEAMILVLHDSSHPIQEYTLTQFKIPT